jgi:hypothetical protein
MTDTLLWTATKETDFISCRSEELRSWSGYYKGRELPSWACEAVCFLRRSLSNAVPVNKVIIPKILQKPTKCAVGLSQLNYINILKVEDYYMF